MLLPIIITSLFYLAIGALCLESHNAGRIFVGLFFWLMAVGVHGYFIIVNPQGYVDFAESAYFGVYHDVSLPIIEFSPRGFGVALGLFEFVVGTLILSRDGYVKIGLAGATAFLLAITPLGGWTLPNLILAATLAYLLTKNFDASLWTSMYRRFHPGRGSSMKGSNAGSV